MNLNETSHLAISLMVKHSLIEQGWSFKYDEAKRRFGCCSYKDKLIILSEPLTVLNSEDQVLDTILHEIAHALVGMGHGHDRVWKAKCVEIGCRPIRCYDETVKQPPAKYRTECHSCHKVYERIKRPRDTKYTCPCQAKQPIKNRLIWTRIYKRNLVEK